MGVKKTNGVAAQGGLAQYWAWSGRQWRVVSSVKLCPARNAVISWEGRLSQDLEGLGSDKEKNQMAIN